MKMLAAVLRETGAKRPYATSQPVQIEEVELAPPQAGELMIKIAMADYAIQISPL